MVVRSALACSIIIMCAASAQAGATLSSATDALGKHDGPTEVELLQEVLARLDDAFSGAPGVGATGGGGNGAEFDPDLDASDGDVGVAARVTVNDRGTGGSWSAGTGVVSNVAVDDQRTASHVHASPNGASLAVAGKSIFDAGGAADTSAPPDQGGHGAFDVTHGDLSSGDADSLSAGATVCIGVEAVGSNCIQQRHTTPSWTAPGPRPVAALGTAQHVDAAAPSTGPFSAGTTASEAASPAAPWTPGKDLEAGPENAAPAGAMRLAATPVSEAMAIVAAGLVAAIIILRIAVIAAGALFSRLRDDELADHPARRAILDAVAAEPGAHHRRVARMTGLSSSSIDYHVRRLWKAGKVRRRKAGFTTHYYPADSAPADLAVTAALHNDTSRAVVQAILASPGRPVKAAAADAGIPLNLASYHVKKLEAVGLLTSRREGKNRLLFPGEPALANVAATV